jgi:arylsulfatase A-like enzyme
VIRWPGKVRPRQSDALASSIDLAPTILTATGLKPTAEMPGINLLDEAAVDRRKAIFGEIFTHDAVDIHWPSSSLRYRWVVEEHWKLIVPAPQNTPGAAVELYDLKADPSETRSLAAESPQRVAHLRTLVDENWPGRD